MGKFRTLLSGILVLVGVLVLVLPASSQGLPYFRKEVGPGGGNAPYPVVTVCTSGASLLIQPCSGHAVIYMDSALSIPLANPFRGDANGNEEFYAAPGVYVISIGAPFNPGYSFKVSIGSGSLITASATDVVFAASDGTFTGDPDFTYTSHRLTILSPSTTQTPVVIASVGATSTVSLLDLENNALSTSAGILSVNGKGMGSYTPGHNPSVVGINVDDGNTNNAFGIAITREGVTGSAGVKSNLQMGENTSGQGYIFAGNTPGDSNGEYSGISIGFGSINYILGDAADNESHIFFSPTVPVSGPHAVTANVLEVLDQTQAIIAGYDTTAAPFSNLPFTWWGLSSGHASIGVPSAAGTPCEILLPTTSPSVNGQVLSINNSTCQTSWATAATLPSASSAGTIYYWDGSAIQVLAGNTTATHYLQETSGGVPSWTTPSGSGNVSNSGTPTANQLAVWIDATDIKGIAPSILAAPFGSEGTTSTVLHGNASGVFTFGKVALATDISGQLAIANVGSAGLSGTGLISVASTGVISCTLCGSTSVGLGQFAATSSSAFFGVINDESGSGVVVGNISPSFTTPTLGVAAATSINKVTITAPASTAVLTIANTKTLTASNTVTFTGTDGSTENIGAGGTTAHVICSGSFSLSTTAISAGSHNNTTHTCTGLTTSSTMIVTFNADTNGVTGYAPSTAGGLTIKIFPTANTINADQINDTVSTITPGTITVNYLVLG